MSGVLGAFRAGILGLNPHCLMLFSYESSIDRTIVMAMKDTAKLSAKFQISIPKAVRMARRWQAGVRLHP